MLELVTSVKIADMYRKIDPICPHISGAVRLTPGRQMYHINEEAFLCTAYLDRVPDTEEQLLSCDIGLIVVAYTVWSLKKGMGRTIIFEAIKMIEEYQFDRFVTLSPKTDMAMKFHLSNGAELIAENTHSNNFEYFLKK
tara:strand:- start:69 stop:485 length:417 start_codon:yes stop_codon:yes gene_type:complete